VAIRKPSPSEMQERIIVRLPDGMRDRLAELAKSNNRSVNAEVVNCLEALLSRVKKPLLVDNENTAEADVTLELKSLRAEFAELRETIGVPDFTDRGTAIYDTRNMVGELLEAVKALAKSISPGDASK
jgi:hypothetical protein